MTDRFLRFPERGALLIHFTSRTPQRRLRARSPGSFGACASVLAERFWHDGANRLYQWRHRDSVSNSGRRDTGPKEDVGVALPARHCSCASMISGRVFRRVFEPEIDRLGIWNRCFARHGVWKSAGDLKVKAAPNTADSRYEPG